MVALAGFGAMPAMAQAPLIDTSVVTDNTTDSRTDGAISLKLEVDNDTSVEQLEAFINPVAPTNVRFLIASNGPDAVLFYSAPVAVGGEHSGCRARRSISLCSRGSAMRLPLWLKAKLPFPGA